MKPEVNDATIYFKSRWINLVDTPNAVIVTSTFHSNLAQLVTCCGQMLARGGMIIVLIRYVNHCFRIENIACIVFVVSRLMLNVKKMNKYYYTQLSVRYNIAQRGRVDLVECIHDCVKRCR